MAQPSDIENVRRLVGEEDDETYSDGDLGDLIDQLGLNPTVAHVWRQKAAIYAELVNTSEGGASRSLGDLHKNALAMAKTYDVLSEKEQVVVSGATHPRVSKIVRST